MVSAKMKAGKTAHSYTEEPPVSDFFQCGESEMTLAARACASQPSLSINWEQTSTTGRRANFLIQNRTRARMQLKFRFNLKPQSEYDWRAAAAGWGLELARVRFVRVILFVCP